MVAGRDWTTCPVLDAAGDLLRTGGQLPAVLKNITSCAFLMATLCLCWKPWGLICARADLSQEFCNWSNKVSCCCSLQELLHPPLGVMAHVVAVVDDVFAKLRLESGRIWFWRRRARAGAWDTGDWRLAEAAVSWWGQWAIQAIRFIFSPACMMYMRNTLCNLAKYV